MLEQMFKEHKLYKRDVAKVLKMDRGALARALNGESSLKAEHIPVLAKILNVTPLQLLNVYMEDRKEHEKIRKSNN